MIIQFLVLLFPLNSNALEACGKVKFSPKMACERANVSFDVSDCETGGGVNVVASNAICDKSEMVATYKSKLSTYRAVFVKGYTGLWEQKGRVWKSGGAKQKAAVLSAPSISNSPNPGNQSIPLPVTNVSNDIAANTATTPPALQAQDSNRSNAENSIPKSSDIQTDFPIPLKESEGTASQTNAPVAVIQSQNPTDSIREPTNSDWSYKFSGWVLTEYEALENFGDGVSTKFSSNDPLASQKDLNLLSNLQLNASKGSLMLQAIFEVGEIFFGDATTGGNQGLRKNNVEVRNLFAEEEFANGFFFRVGAFSISSDPRGFILSDHHTGAQVRYEDQGMISQIWFADATNGKPGTRVNGEQYFGVSHVQPYNGTDSVTFFGVYRTLKESFVDVDLTTSLADGRSNYVWGGFNNINKKMFGLNLELNAIVSQASFKADSGQTDSNIEWLAHAKLDKDIEDGWNLAFDGLMTSGANDSRSGTSQVLGKRKNFTSPNPSSSYLLTLATSDGGDDAAGSVRQPTNIIGRLDLDEGLQVYVGTISKSFSDKFESFLRYGLLKSTAANLTTGSNAYGSEFDVRLKYKSTETSSFILDYGVFTPGAFFANTDKASLISLRYKLEI